MNTPALSTSAPGGGGAPGAAHEYGGRAIALLVRAVLLETLRRKDFYVLFLLTALFSISMLVVNLIGIENDSTATMLLNLGMSFSWFAAHILTLLTAARQIPGEIESRQMYPLLAKPVRRGEYLAAKWLGATLAGAAALLFLFLISYLPVPRLQTVSGGLLAQLLVLEVVSIAVLAALALLGSLIFPQGVNVTLIALLWLTGARATQFALARAADGPLEGLLRWFAGYLPDFSRLNLITRYTDGIGPLDAGTLFRLILLGALWVAISLAAAGWIFQRRPL